MMYTIGLGEAVSIYRGDQATLIRVVSRECADVPRRTQAYVECTTRVEDEADLLAQGSEQRGLATIRGLGTLLTGLRSIDAPKTVVLLTEGFIVNDGQTMVAEIGGMAAAARASLYVLQLDDTPDVTAKRGSGSLDDRQLRTAELEALAGAARGDVFRVAGAGDVAFGRVRSELAGYYLLGVESDARDRDGKTHPVRVDVARSGAVVRSRQQVLDVSSRAASPQQAAASGLVSPLPLATLPVRLATFALQGPERGKVQMLIHADIGNDYSGPRVVSIAYAIFDRRGQALESHLYSARLQPEVNGVPAALEFAAGASLTAGEYTLKFVAAEGDRAGSVEHPMHAALVDAGGVTLSELMVGGPADLHELLQPTVGFAVNFGVVHGYLEAYGPQAEAVTVKYEIAADAASAPLITANVPGRLAGADDRMIFTSSMAVPQLPPGRYVLRAQVSAAAKPVKTLSRAFLIVPPAVLMTPAQGTGAASGDVDLFLPVDEVALARPFVRDDALKPEVLAPFQARVSAITKPAFSAGIAALTARDVRRAEAALKQAVQPDNDSTAALAYLGVLYATTGHEPEAAGAWQTALIDGSDMPQIYEWLAQSMLRTHSLPDARATLEEAVGKWPSDPRFTGPLAQVYATFGKGHEAVRLLERYLDARQDDAESCRLGVSWIYQVHSSGSVAITPADDRRLAHAWAERYGAGPQQALVRQWLDFLDREGK
jgi:tetratricopeptide (TPR) repeat protein